MKKKLLLTILPLFCLLMLYQEGLSAEGGGVCYETLYLWTDHQGGKHLTDTAPSSSEAKEVEEVEYARQTTPSSTPPAKTYARRSTPTYVRSVASVSSWRPASSTKPKLTVPENQQTAFDSFPSNWDNFNAGARRA